MRRKLFLALSVFLLGFLLLIIPEESYIQFENAFAQVDTPLVVEDFGYPLGTDFYYHWEIDGVPIDCSASSYTPTEEDLESFITVTVTNSSSKEKITLSTYFSKLPVLYLDVEDTIEKDIYTTGTLTLQGNALYDQPEFLYQGDIEIRGRGNSTWDAYPKKPYKLKLDRAADLFGMGESKHWILFANYADESLMRNKIAYDLSGELGMPYMESAWVSVVMNGTYLGNYLLCEQIRIEEDRINISDLNSYADKLARALVDADIIPRAKRQTLKDALEQDLSWLSTGVFVYNDISYDISPYIALPKLTGGFIMEIDGYFDKPSKYYAYGLPMMFNTPDYAFTNRDLMSWSESYFNAAFGAMMNPDAFYALYNDTLVSYTEMFDVHSLAQYLLIQEIFFNYDAESKSNYLYKDTDSIAYMGPIWDMDWSSGRTHSEISYEQWWSVYYGEKSTDALWYRYVIQDPYFLSIMKEVWDSSYDAIQALVAENGTLQQTYDYIYESAVANASRWGYETDFSFSYDIYYQWVTDRLAWLEEQFTTLDRLATSIGYQRDPSIQIDIIGDSILASTPYGVAAVLYYNGIRQGEQAILSEIIEWDNPLPTNILDSDIITIRIYDESGNLIGSNFLDFRN